MTLANASQIDRDIPCRDCGYNLRTLPAESRCPECGLPVADSLNNWLADIDPHKSYLLRRGAKWTIAVIALRIPLMLLWTFMLHPSILDFFGTHVAFRPTWFYVRQFMMNPLIPILFITFDCIAFVFLSSLRHPHIRKSIPTIAAAAVVIDLCLFGPTVREALIASLIVVDLIFFGAIAFFWSRDAMRIAQKAGERALARGFTVCGAVLPFSILPCLAAMELLMMTESTESQSLAVAAMKIATDIILIPTIVYFCYLLLVLNARLGKTIRLARQLRGSALPQRTIESITPIDRNIPCRQCGHNLQTLLAGARCPECGNPVADTLYNWAEKIDPEKSPLLQSGAVFIAIVTALQVCLAAAWLAIILVPYLQFRFGTISFVYDNATPLTLLAFDCVVFLAVSPLHRRPGRFLILILALGAAIGRKFNPFWSLNPVDEVAYFYILQSNFFAAISFFWCADAARIARRAGERSLRRILLSCAALIPIACLIFAVEGQRPDGLANSVANLLWNSFTFYQPIYNTESDVWIAFSQTLLIAALIVMTISLLSLRARLPRILTLVER